MYVVQVKRQLFLLKVLAGRFVSICVFQYQKIHAPPLFLAASNFFDLKRFCFSYFYFCIHAVENQNVKWNLKTLVTLAYNNNNMEAPKVSDKKLFS